MNTVFLKLLQAMLLLLFHLQLRLLASNSWSAVGTEVRCIEREKQALLQLKAGFVDDYGFLSSWGNEEEKRDCCQWERVRCSKQTGHVQMLHLQGEVSEHELDELLHYSAFLRGNISTSLMKLQHLRYLNLRWNHFGYSHIPNFFGSLRNLRFLDVSSSDFAGKIPRELGSLSHLQHLDLSLNFLEGAIPFQLGNLSQLQYLDVHTNNLIGAIPYQLGNLINLQELYLGYNYLLINKENGADVQFLANLTSLTILDLSSTLNFPNSLQIISKLQNLIQLLVADSRLLDHDILFLDPSKFNVSSSLTILDLSANNLTARSMKSLGNICTLSMLFLDSVDLSEDFSTILHNLSGCARYTLQELHLGYNQITGLLSDVSEFPSLKLLYLSENQLKGIAEGVRLSSLETLVVSSNSIEGGIPESFGKICSLRSLDLSDNRLSNELPMIIYNLFECRLTLQKLILSENQITGGLPSLSNFPSLKSLYLSTNQLNEIAEGVRLPSSLETLVVSSNLLQGGIPKSFGKTCSLRSLDLSNNSLSNEFPLIIQNLLGCARSLQHLDLFLNYITGTMPDLSKFSSLEHFDVSYNQLSGMIPKDVKFPSQLESLMIASNSKLKGLIMDSHFANMSKLQNLDLSFSSLTLTLSPNWIPSFQLTAIRLSSTNLGPQFPKWIQTQKTIFVLDISNCRISDMVPEWFWSLSPTMSFLNISYNNLAGTIPPLLRSATSVGLSKKKFSSANMFICANITLGKLGILDFSNTNLSGQLPNCWNNFRSLKFLDMSDNKLSGKVPDSIGSLVELRVLVLRNNKLSGNLPLSMKNCTKLEILDIGENRLSGKIPFWIGNAFKQLRMLSLRINHFFGSIPLDLCHLTSLQFLDLSLNKLSGEIPEWVKHFTAMSQKKKWVDISYYRFEDVGGVMGVIGYELIAQLMWKGFPQKFKNGAIFLLVSIDLSNNQLIGGIPTEITNLIELVSLNLSRNNLSGEIPSKIGMLTSLEFLDLSRNRLYGKIPSSLVHIDRLTMLDLSHNQLAGRIPSSTQLQGFDASSYEENLDLCGKPLEKECPQEEPVHKPPEFEENGHSLLSQPFYISMALGFSTGFWGIFGSILVNRSWRHAYFRFLNNLTDAIYVMIAINIVAKCGG